MLEKIKEEAAEAAEAAKAAKAAAPTGVAEYSHLRPGHLTPAQLHVYPSAQAAATGLAHAVSSAAVRAIEAKGSFTLVLSGGSLIHGLTPITSQPGVDWARWYVFYVDERNVPHSSEDSNHKVRPPGIGGLSTRSRVYGGWQVVSDHKVWPEFGGLSV